MQSHKARCYRLFAAGCQLLAVMALLALAPMPAAAQVNTAELGGTVLDPSNAGVPGATVTLKNLANGATRSTTSDPQGRYLLVNLPPGRYELTVQATGFGTLKTPELILTIGQSAEYDPRLQVADAGQVITVEGGADVIETSRTHVADTVDSRRINNLPINGRNYINFTLTNSQATRDSAPSIGAAPTSGINFAGQRARSNQVSVDGADAVDNSVNGVRATVSQEAVQEFQLIISNYNAEFGRATGGVVNIVTKSGGNNVHGNLFGYLRHKSIQARNPFSVQVDPATGAVRAVKQGFTRLQAGATIGGPIKQDKTFYFLAYETTRRQETGFTNIGANNFGLVPTTTPFFPAPLLLTPQQAAFVSNPAVLAAPGGATLAANVALIAGSASSVALTGVDFGAIATARGVPSAPGPRFPIPIDCSPPAVLCSASSLVPLPASYKTLQSLIGNYPISEGTSLWSGRFDHQWNERNNSFLRINITPSLVTGIQVNAQNQNFGQNAASRTSLQQTRDVAGVASHSRLWTNHFISEGRFQFARRGLHYGFADFPGGSDVAINMTGFAFFGREPFSTVDRIERRWQWTGNHTWIKGSHAIKFGSDSNLIQLRSKKAQIFELNFGGLFNFGGLTASNLGLPSTFAGAAVPGVTAVQAYGLGLPSVFVQGIGQSDRPLENTTWAIFIQDSWKVHPRLTFNFGVRWDYEQTPLFTPATPVNAAAEAAFGLVEGIPRDKNNLAPRIGLAWDPTGSGAWLVRAGYGIFFDHPLLAVAFNSTTAEGALSSQLVTAGGAPTGAAVTPLNAATALNAASIFQGVLGRSTGTCSAGTNPVGLPASFGYLCAQQRFDPKLPNSIFTNHNFLASGFPIPLLPFTLHVDADFEYAYSQQGNLSLERRIGQDYKFGLSYTYAHSVHLNRPRNITPSDPGRLARNFRNAFAAGIVASNPVTVAAPLANIAATATTCALTLLAPGALGVLSGCPASGANAGFNGQFVGTAAFFNFFRPQGPNPSFQALAGGYANQVALATAAGFPTGVTGVQVPWSDVMQQESSGNAIYHGMTVTFSKRFASHFEFLSSWTYSHAIDDSTDLQTLLAPQDNNRPDLERSDSTFDQRHRWVFSAVIESPFKWSDEGFFKKLTSGWVVAPIWEMAAGRPFTVLTGSDFNLDFGSNTDRPSHLPAGGVPSFFLPQAGTFAPPTVCPTDPVSGNPSNTIFAGTTLPSFFGCTGNLGRNEFKRPQFVALDLRLSRRFAINERWSFDFIVDIFNLFNRFNVGDVSPLCNPLDPAACRAGEPTAALDPRQFQFALKINW